MPVKIYPAAKARILEIWDHTEKKWGENQADAYVRDLVETINRASQDRHWWRPVMDEALKGICFTRHSHHFIFFRELPTGTLGIVSILHETMDLPARLKEVYDLGSGAEPPFSGPALGSFSMLQCIALADHLRREPSAF